MEGLSEEQCKRSLHVNLKSLELLYNKLDLEQELENKFSPYGIISDLKVISDQNIAILTFSSPLESSLALLKEQTCCAIEGYKVEIKPIEYRGPVRTLYVGAASIYKSSSKKKINNKAIYTEIKEKFSNFGKVKKIEIKNNLAFVVYSEADSAVKARKLLDGEKLDGHRMVVRIKDNDNTCDNGFQKYDGKQSYIVVEGASIVKEDDVKTELLDRFSNYGIVDSVNLLYGRATVLFKSLVATARDISWYEENKRFRYKNIKVKVYNKNYRLNRECKGSKLFVNCVSISEKCPAAMRKELLEKFKVYGEVENVVVRNGFAFVDFKSSAEATKALTAEDGEQFLGMEMAIDESLQSSREFKTLEIMGQYQEWKVPEGENNEDSKAKPLLSDDSIYQPSTQFSLPSPNPPVLLFMQSKLNSLPSKRQTLLPPPVNSCASENSTQINNVKEKDLVVLFLEEDSLNYGLSLESQLTSMGLLIEILQPKVQDLGRVIENITSRGVTAVILVNSESERTKTISLKVLKGNYKENLKDYSVKEGLRLIGKVFNRFVEEDPEVVTEVQENIPEDVKKIIGFLEAERPVSIIEYDKVIKFLVKQREKFLIEEHEGEVPDHLLLPPVGPFQDPELVQTKEVIVKALYKLMEVKEQPVKKKTSVEINEAIDKLLSAGPALLNIIQSCSRSAVNNSGDTLRSQSVTSSCSDHQQQLEEGPSPSTDQHNPKRKRLPSVERSQRRSQTLSSGYASPEAVAFED